MFRYFGDGCSLTSGSELAVRGEILHSIEPQGHRAREHDLSLIQVVVVNKCMLHE